jgi:hypothetical protein
MNERFKELAAQAGILCKPRQLLDDDCPNGYLVSDKDHADDNWQEVRAFFDGGLDKFAELIVNECRDVVISNFHECRSVSRLDKIVREHFGVK